MAMNPAQSQLFNDPLVKDDLDLFGLEADRGPIRIERERGHELVREIADKVASHAPITLWVTKEAIRRIHHRESISGLFPA